MKVLKILLLPLLLLFTASCGSTKFVCYQTEMEKATITHEEQSPMEVPVVSTKVFGVGNEINISNHTISGDLLFVSTSGSAYGEIKVSNCSKSKATIIWKDSYFIDQNGVLHHIVPLNLCLAPIKNTESVLPQETSTSKFALSDKMKYHGKELHCDSTSGHFIGDYYVPGKTKIYTTGDFWSGQEIIKSGDFKNDDAIQAYLNNPMTLCIVIEHKKTIKTFTFKYKFTGFEWTELNPANIPAIAAMQNIINSKSSDKKKRPLTEQ